MILLFLSLKITQMCFLIAMTVTINPTWAEFFFFLMFCHNYCDILALTVYSNLFWFAFFLITFFFLIILSLFFVFMGTENFLIYREGFVDQCWPFEGLCIWFKD